MAEKNTVTLSQLIELLEPLSEEERLRTVRAALTFLGSTQVGSRSSGGSPHQVGSADYEEPGESDTAIPPRASRWLKQNGLEVSTMDSVFHFRDGQVEIIADDVPGTDMKERTKHCYLLCGVRSLLQDGEARINDDEARELCRHIGCYDSTNHTKRVKAIRNLVTGTKSSGYELTQPGLCAAAETIRAITGG